MAYCQWMSGYFQVAISKADQLPNKGKNMLQIGKKWLFLLCLILSLPVLADAHLQKIPILSAPVMDTAKMMSPTKSVELNQELLDYSRTSGSQIIVLTVDKVLPETPFDYGTRVFDAWKIGRKGIDDGILLLIVRDERKTQLLVGSGLEGAIPDAYAKRILDEIITPHFRNQDIDGGIVEAVEQIKQLIAGEGFPKSKNHQQNQQQDSDDLPIVLLIFGAILGRMIKLAGAPYVGSIVGGASAGLAAFLFGFGMVGIIIIVILAILAVSFLQGGSTSGGGGGFSSGGGGGFSGGGGGGFSGGGGGFSGGGASGGW